ncbi:4-hydroxythreonine-4-phosphate dehydrogenase PdxA [bacterium]|nr:4-hydroxythreonine-4-phosphate dehydrogenase PdxA [bacterium]
MSHGHKKNLPKVAITVGDLNGIGPEIIIKSFKEDRFLNLCTPIIYGSAQTMIYHKKLLQNKYFNFQLIKSPDEARPRKINLINAWDDEVKIQIGESQVNTGKTAYKALQAAVADLKAGEVDVLVTAPIHKKSIQQAGMEFPGHTEFLANAFETDQQLMLLVGERMKIAVATGHIPLEKVAQELTKKKVLKALKALNKSMIEDFGLVRPQIAVLGLNPHAGENGSMGSEEDDVITPAIEEAGRHGITALGPYPADGFFGTRMHTRFDAILAMYHDQGLVPFKLLEFENGVNYTAGLPIVRTSPDHGTAFSIAGKNEANEQSFVEAVYLALKIQANRENYAEMTANPLETRMEKQKERE